MAVWDWDTDPTYKEWKHEENGVPPARTGEYTDPTYKEWKLLLPILPAGVYMDTDPTYKEWKLIMPIYLKEPITVTRILPTRNGNPMTSFDLISALAIHGSYLQGMETRLRAFIEMPGGGVHGSYLQGMETILELEFRNRSVSHGSYLQGMETPDDGVCAPTKGQTRILPTRNGNDDWRCAFRLCPLCTRILPTRNGNLASPRIVTSPPGPHGSYLQGMET